MKVRHVGERAEGAGGQPGRSGEMLTLGFGSVRHLVCIGAHPDDIEIGCGGTIRRILEASPHVTVRWLVFSGAGPRRLEARRSAAAFLKGARRSRIRVARFHESYFPEQWAAIKDVFEDIKREGEPDLVLTHWRDDRHQDHRVLSDLAWNTFRNHIILEYEIPKYDGDLGNPNLYVTLSEDAARRKVADVLLHFRSQATKHWFTEDTLLALMRLRGIECGPRARFAEAFYARKLVF